MAIYGRFGQTVELIRMATLDDVKRLEKRRPDKQDKAAVEAGSYVVCRTLSYNDGSEPKHDYSKEEWISHLAFLRADGAIKEIIEVIANLPDVIAAAQMG